MALIISETNIPNSAIIKFRDTILTKIIYDGVMIWQKVQTIIAKNISLSITASSFGDSNGSASGKVTVSGNALNGTASNCSYGTWSAEGIGNYIDCTGYSKAVFNLTDGYFKITIGGRSAETGKPESRGTGNLSINVSGLGRARFSFVWKSSCNTPWQGDRNVKSTINSITLS